MIEGKVTGEAELFRRFQAFSMKLKKEIAYEALFEAAAPMLERAREMAPVDAGPHAKHPGELKDSLRLDMIRDKTAIIARVTTGRDGWYGRLVEFGHRIAHKATGVLRRHKSAKSRANDAAQGWVPPHPFMRPAYEATKDEVFNRTAELFPGKIEAALARQK